MNIFGTPHRRGRPMGRRDLKPAMKEKFVSIYNDIFSGSSAMQRAREEGFEGRQALNRFWDELLLLKVNEGHLSQCIAAKTEEQITGPFRPTINELFGTCVRYLNDVSFIRVAHAIETLAVLFREIFKKRFSEQAFTVITLVAGTADNADDFFKRLLGDVTSLLARDDVPLLVKALGLRLFLVLLTATDNINTNSIASFFFVNDVSPALFAILTIKLPHHRQRLELNACVTLLLLLLWRESNNIYIDRVSSVSGPLLPLLHATLSLLSRPTEIRAANNFVTLQKSVTADAGVPAGSNRQLAAEDSASQIQTQAWELASSFASTAATSAYAASSSVYFYAGQLLGLPASTGQGAESSSAGASANEGAAGDGSSEKDKVDLGWSNVSSAAALLYFLVHLNPAMRSSTLWPSGGFSYAGGQPLASLWGDILRLFLTTCESSLAPATALTPAGAPRAKVLLLSLRCLFEDQVSADFLFRCDATSLDLMPLEPPSPTASPGLPSHLPPSSSTLVLHQLLNRCIDLLSAAPLTTPLPPHAAPAAADVDLLSRLCLFIGQLFNLVRSKRHVVSSSTVNLTALWRGLMRICRWCSEEANAQRPSVLELGEAALAILESCLGSSMDLFATQDDVERFHSLVLADMASAEALAAAAEKSPFTGSDRKIVGGLTLINVKELKEYYELQAAALGLRLPLQEDQALSVVKAKGSLGLRFKARHCGPPHTYTEGVAELRVLTSIARLLVGENRKQYWKSLPNFEMEHL